MKNLYFKFQDDVAIKTLQNNISSMFVQWEKASEKFEEKMLKMGVSKHAIDHSRKFWKY